MLRVLHVFGGMDRGGAESMVMNAYRRIDRDLIRFDFAVHTDKPCHFDEEIERLGGTIIRLPNPGQVGLIAYRAALTEAFARFGPYDAVHSHVHLFSGWILRTAYQSKVPVRIAHSHTTRDGNDAIRRAVYRLLMTTWIRKYATHRLACSAGASEALFGKSSLRKNAAEVLPNGIDGEGLARDYAGAKERLQSSLGLPRSSVLIGQIGRFSHEKNQSFTVDIFRAYLRTEENAHLVFIGDGPMAEEIRRKAATLGLSERISFLGIRDDVPELLHGLDFLLMPSKFEGLGIAVVEAQAAGTPVLGSDAIPPEADLHCGLISRLSVAESAERWARKMQDMLRECIHPSFEDRIKAIHAHKYDVHYTSQRLEEIYGQYRHE